MTEAADHLDRLVSTSIVALLRLIDGSVDGGVERMIEQHPFLLDHVATAAASVDEGDDWDTAFDRFFDDLTEFEAERPDLPLRRVNGLDDVHARLVWAFVGLTAEDLRFGAIARSLQVPDDATTFAPQTVAAALDGPGSRATARTIGALFQRHLLRRLPVPTDGGIEVDPAAWELAWCADDAEQVAGPPDEPADGGAGAMDHWHPERRAEVDAAITRLLDARVDTLVVRAVPGADAERTIGAALATHDTRPWAADPDGLDTGSDLCRAQMCGAVPTISLDIRAGTEAPSPRPGWYRGPLIAIIGRTGGLRPDGDRRLHLELDRCDAAERAEFWRHVHPRPTPRPETLSAAFVLPDGHLRRIVRDATTRARAAGRFRPVAADLRAASDEMSRHALETRAAIVPGEGLTWDDVVVPDRVAAALRSLERRCELRERLADGQRSRGAAGVRALLLGPSGVGKTLAATVLGAQLGRRIHRLDLAAVFDKYVGETEKHLDAVLGAAEQLDCVLLIDEGDTLLGARTDGSTANDRYANLETNFLLQRLEDYTGIVVITSNAADRIDSAFARRMDATITFPRPRAAERAAIWRLHLPDCDVDDETLHRVATRHRLTGGQIRNAALHAIMLSLDADEPVDAARITAAVDAEYRKSGRLLPGPRTAVEDAARRRTDFLAAQAAIGHRDAEARGA